MSRKTANERDFFNGLAAAGTCFDKLKDENAGLKIDIIELRAENEGLQKQLKELRAQQKEAETNRLLAQVDANYAALGS